MLAVSKKAIYGYVFVGVTNMYTLYGFAMDTCEQHWSVIGSIIFHIILKNMFLILVFPDHIHLPFLSPIWNVDAKS